MINDDDRISIGMVANFWLTPTMFQTAQRLTSDYGYIVHWFVVSAKWHRWLRRNGVAESRIISLHQRPLRGDMRTADAGRVSTEPGIDYLVRSDRVLGRRRRSHSYRLLSSTSLRAKREIAARGIRVVFGETTWASEVVIAYAARTAGAIYVSPISVRIPAGRIGFVAGPLHKRLLAVDENQNAAHRELAAIAYDEFVERRSGGLWKHNEFSVSKYLREPCLWVEKFLDSIFDARWNATQPTLLRYFLDKNPALMALNARRLGSYLRERSLKSPSELSGPYVLMPLQVQPEASVDIVAWSASDQVANVAAVSRALPAGMCVAVKEHSHRFGSRGIEAFRRIAELPNVEFVDPHADSRDWMRSASAVIAASGTMCLENALEGRRSVVFAPIFFESLPTVRRFDVNDLDGLAEFLISDVDASARGAGVRYLESILDHSFVGSFTAERDVPGSTGDKNVTALASAFASLIRENA